MTTQVSFDLWEDLLTYIHEGLVVPIVGADLLMLNTPRGPENLYKIVADRLAEQLHVSKEGLSADRPLDDVVARYLNSGGVKDRLYVKIKQILDQQEEIPEPLLQLAAIPTFKLFVTTTFDSMLEMALRQARPGQKIVRLDYAINNAKDLPADLDGADIYVYHLLGLRSSLPMFALTQEDLLEFIIALMQEDKPERLLDELCKHHLLFLGTGFRDWLARLVIRLAKGSRSTRQPGYGEFLVDRTALQDIDLVTFLSVFSKETAMYQDGSAVQFIDELQRRYLEKFAGEPGGKSEKPAKQEMPASLVFLSYAHEDIKAAQSIRDALSAAGIEVWFDKTALMGAEDWLREIRKRIKECALFIPLISRTTMGRDEGEFRREWKIALDKAETFGDRLPFILPTAIDHVPQTDEANVPEHFLSKHWRSLPDGKANSEYVTRVRDLLRQRVANKGARL